MECSLTICPGGKASLSRKAAEERGPQRKLWVASEKPTEAPAGRKNRHGDRATSPFPKRNRWAVVTPVFSRFCV